MTTQPIIDENTQQIINEKSQLLPSKAIDDMNSLLSVRDDINVMDIFTYLKFMNVYGAKVISQASLKGDMHPNVRTVLEDIHITSLALRNELEAINPELADDYIWPEANNEKKEE